MNNQNIRRTKVNGETIHPRVMLNKMCFDFRNAKPALFSASYCKSDDSWTKPDVQQTRLSFDESTKQVEHTRVDVQCRVDSTGADAAGMCNTGQPVAGRAVQVDDGDLDRLVGVSDAAAVELYSSSVVDVSEPAEENCAIPIITTECTEFTDRSLPNCTAPGNKILPPENASLSSRIASLPCQMERNKQTDFAYRKKEARKSKWTENTVAENETAVEVDSIVLKPLLVNEPCLHKDSMTVAPQSRSVSHNNIESSGTGGHSENSFPSNNSPIVLFDDNLDDLDDVPLSERKTVVQPVCRVKKSRTSRDVHSLYNVTASRIKSEHKCRNNKPRVVQALKRKRRKKYDSEDEVWSAQKKLLIMPIDKKFKRCGRTRKQKLRRGLRAPIPKRKRRRSATVEGMELPDLSTSLDDGVDIADMSDILKMYDWEPDMDNSVSANVSRKWYVDITGADLDTDYKQVTESSHQPKSPVTDKAGEQNIAEFVPQYATDSACHCTNFSNSQETPPPSVASDGLSSCDEPGQSVMSSVEDEEVQESVDNQWLTIDTKLAHYIDGRRFDRLVNGVSVQVPSTLMSETVGQIGKECLHLAKMTKRDVKELQDQVRLEEIYHRRVKKATLSSKSVRHRASRQRGVSRVVQRSAAKTAAKSRRTEIESEVAETDEVNQEDASSAVDDNLCAAECDDDTVSYLSSDDSTAAGSNNFVLEPVGMYTSELLQGNVIETNQGAERSHHNIDHAKLQESPIVVRIRRFAIGKNLSQTSDQFREPTPVGVDVHQRKQTPASSTCNVSESASKSDFPVIGDECHNDSHKDFSQQKLRENVASVPKRISSGSAANKFQHTATDVANMRTDVSRTDAAGTDHSKYIAAVALASLSMAADSQFHSTRQSLLSESKSCTEITSAASDSCQTDKEHNLTQRDTHAAVTSKSVHEFLPRRQTEQSNTSETHMEASSVKPSKHSAVRNGRQLKDGERRIHRISTDKRCERTPETVGDLVSERTRGASEGQRSRGHRSYSGKAACHQKPISESKEKLSTTGSSKYPVHADSGLSCVSTRNMDKKKREASGSSGSTLDILPKSFNCDASDKTKHKKDRNRNHPSSRKKAVDCQEQEQVITDNSRSCDSSMSAQTRIDSNHHDTDVVAGRSDKPASGENALLLDGTIATLSTINSTNTSTLCSSLPKQLSEVSAPPLQSSSSASHSLSIGTCSDKETHCDDLKSQPKGNAVTSSLPNNTTVEMQTNCDEADGTGNELISDLNSNSVSKLSQVFSTYAAHKQRGDTGPVAQIISGNAVTGNCEIVPQGCLMARSCNKVMYTEAVNSVISDDYTPESPSSPYRESEDIQSPSPGSAHPVEDDRSREIRSPSPCDVESSAAVFRVVETSWDVKLSSPCEIQSPDVSGDEADDCIEEFNRQCDVCFQHGPVTIPLTIEEASNTTQSTAPHDLESTLFPWF